MNNTQKYTIVVVLLLIVGFVVWGVLQAKKNTQSSAEVVAFAQCLASKKVTMYGAYWCSHCQNQKALFGDAFKYVPYVECTENEKLCSAKGVEGFPTWIVTDAAGKDTKLVGEQSFEDLSRASGCPVPRAAQ